MGFTSGKNFVHALGLSCVFRQWRAPDTHCSKIHGYSIQVEFEFERFDGGLDERMWVFGFGDLKPIKAWLESQLDHKYLVAKDDPYLEEILKLQTLGIADINVVDNIGCESFAKMIYEYTAEWLKENFHGVFLSKITVREHEGNWASYSPL